MRRPYGGTPRLSYPETVSSHHPTLALTRRGLVVLAGAGLLMGGLVASALTPRPAPKPAVSSAVVHTTAPATVVTVAPGSAGSASTAAVPATTQAPAAPAGDVDCAKLKCVALTYDDGPSPYSQTLLNSLEAAGVKATFFQIGENVAKRPGDTKRAVSMGMPVGSHTWDHPNLAKLAPGVQASQVNRASDAIEQASGVRPTLLRPPYGAVNSGTAQLGYPIIQWDVDTRDWATHSSDSTYNTVMKLVRPGSIVLMHETERSSVNVTPSLIKALQAKGYTLVTVPQLLGNVPAGKQYFTRTDVR